MEYLWTMAKVDIALVSMPWHDFYKPNFFLGSLNSYLKSNLSEVNVKNFNLHLRTAALTGFSYYGRLKRYIKTNSDPSFIPKLVLESLYAQLIYPNLELLYEPNFIKETFKTKSELEGFLRKLESSQQEIFDSIDWSKYDVVVFTLGYAQLTSSLDLIKRIKKGYPEKRIILEGSKISKDKAKSLLRRLDEIDFVVKEYNSLLRLIKTIKENESPQDVPGLIYRNEGKITCNPGPDKEGIKFVKPDYSAYFNQVSEYGSSIGGGDVVVPLKYRSKESEFIEKVEFFYNRYEAKKFDLIDSVSGKDLKRICSALRKIDRDMKIWGAHTCEKLEPSVFKSMAKISDMELVMEIGALSNSILDKMNVQNELIDKIQALKLAESYGINLEYELMVGYPLVEQEEIEDSIETLSKIKHLRPPRRIRRFELERDSDFFENQEKYRITSNDFRPEYNYIFPKEVRKEPELEYLQYKNQLDVDWNSLIEKVKEWQTEYKELKSDLPPLYYTQKEDELLIHERKLKERSFYRLNEIQSKVYDFCNTIKEFKEIKNKFSISREKLKGELDKLVGKDLIFKDGDRYLTLAVGLETYQEHNEPNEVFQLE